MCGICGSFDPREQRDREAERRVLKTMTDAILHRGPNSAGHWVGERVALGMRRLAIVDLMHGDQPVRSEDGAITVVFNGEIYNHRELRDWLEERGHVLASDADTEVIPHLYEELGTGAFERLAGMFAIALWDDRRQQLVLARDRFGKKPLFWSSRPDGVVVFCSEMKSMWQHPSFEARVDRSRIVEYLMYDSVPSPGSMFEGVNKLDGGHVLVADTTGAISIERYYRPSFAGDVQAPDAGPTSFESAAVDFRARLRDTVEARLMSDVPLGVFLSGGLDSASIVASLADLGQQDVPTFSIGFEEASWDETEHAGAVARHFGMTHHVERLNAARMLELVPDMAEWFDEPVADPSIFPTYLLSRITADHVTVALGGDGGDELLAGYPTASGHRLAQTYNRLPRMLRRTVAAGADRLPVRHSAYSLGLKAQAFVRGADHPLPRRHATWMSPAGAEAALALLAPELRAECTLDAAFGPVDELEAETYGARSWVDVMRFHDLRRYLQDVVLVKVDRASMANSLEVRAPFLDHRLVDWVFTLPPEYVHDGSTSKRLLRAAMRDVLPEQINRRGKQGFGVPVAEWMCGPLGDMVRELLDPVRIADQGLFDPRAVSRIVHEHQSRRFDRRRILWSLVAFQLWHQRWIERTPTDARLSASHV